MCVIVQIAIMVSVIVLSFLMLLVNVMSVNVMNGIRLCVVVVSVYVMSIYMMSVILQIVIRLNVIWLCVVAPIYLTQGNLNCKVRRLKYHSHLRRLLQYHHWCQTNHCYPNLTVLILVHSDTIKMYLHVLPNLSNFTV